jgi:hypothetical protein
MRTDFIISRTANVLVEIIGKKEKKGVNVNP